MSGGYVTDSFRLEQLADGMHRSAHAYKVALYTSDKIFGPFITMYTPEYEAEGEGYVPGGQILKGRAVKLIAGVACMDFLGVEWPTATLEDVRGYLIYNASLPRKPSVFSFDAGFDYAATNGPFRVSFPLPGAQTSLIQWA